MKSKLLVYLMVALFVPPMGASAAWVECPPDKTMATVVNPAGKLIEICVSDEAIDNVGGSGSVVIPDICPCFTLEYVSDVLTNGTFVCNLLEGATVELEKPCTAVACYGEGDFISAARCPDCDDSDPWCWFDLGGGAALVLYYNVCHHELGATVFCTEAEIRACEAMLQIYAD